MKISVIVPAFNEEKLIADSLRSVRASLIAFARVGWESEVIVCDNNSTDRTAELARAGGAMVVFEPVNQIGRARNRGAEAATGDWLMFIDADSYPSPELFGAVTAEIQTGRHLAGGCLMQMAAGDLAARSGVQVWNLISRLTRWAAGAFIFCEANAFRRVGGFNLELYISEEIDLSQRLHKLGRETGRSMVIIRRPPLLTSARKLELYSKAEILSFLTRVVFRPRRTMKSRAACEPWYDGRR